jgi:hypothetical protein
MNEIYTLLIELEYSPSNNWEAVPVWKRTVEMRTDATLDDLHACIQKVVGFDNDHLYEFYVAKKVRSKKTRQFTSEGMTEAEEDEYWEENFGGRPTYPPELLPYLKPEIREEPLDTLLNQIFPLPAGHFLFYMFDYGDNWRFKIRKTNRKPQFAVEGVEYPRVIGGEGDNPEQYPQWNDDEDWADEE